MDNLTIEELKQLVIYYKQKANDLELISLQNQLIVNRPSKSNNQLEDLEKTSVKNKK